MIGRKDLHMPAYQFQAKDRQGVLHEDRLEASDRSHACRLLAARDWFILRVDEEGAGMKEDSKARSWNPPSFSPLVRRRVRRKDVPEKTEQMAQLLRAGMRLSEVLDTMAHRSEDPSWRTVFEALRAAVVGGKPLSEAMAAHPELFDPLFCAMVSTGEASGHLVEVLERLAQYLQRRATIQQQVVSALIYPMIIICAGILTVTFFMVVMLPKLAGMFKEMGQALPWSTRFLIEVSDLMTRFGWLIPLLLVGSWYGFRNWFNDPAHRLAWDRSILRWPVVGGLLALGEYSRFAQTLSTLLQSGVTLVDAMQVAEATVANAALKSAVHDARIQVREGRSLHDSMAASKRFPGMMVDMLMVAERTGDLGGCLQHAAQAYERNLDRAIRNYTALIEPALILLMAGFVGSIVYSILSAVFELTSGVGRI
jgi:general secretion pathway protein F